MPYTLQTPVLLYEIGVQGGIYIPWTCFPDETLDRVYTRVVQSCTQGMFHHCVNRHKGNSTDADSCIRVGVNHDEQQL